MTEARKLSSSWTRVQLNAREWQITFDPVESISDLVRDLRVDCGHAITWAGRIERSDGQDFDAVKGREIAKALTFFFSFAVGRWCPAVLLVGYDSVEKRVWESWGPEISDGWESSKGWLDPYIGHCLSDAFPGFLQKWEKDVWREPLEDAIHWSIEIAKRSPGLDGAIALGQIGLEMLSWVNFVEDTPSIKRSAFKKLTAAEMIRQLLIACSIPVAVPNELATLKKVAQAKKWDGPNAVTKVRNWIIHANQTNRGKLSKTVTKHNVNKRDLKWETYQLLMWYSQMVLLHQFGYAGEYANRFLPRKLGDVEKVPWAN